MRTDSTRVLAAAIVAALFTSALPIPAISAAPPMQTALSGAVGRLRSARGACTFFVVRRDEVVRTAYTGNADLYAPATWDYFIASAGHCYAPDQMTARIGQDEYPVTAIGFSSFAYGVDVLAGVFRSRKDYRALEVDERLPVPGEWLQVVGYPRHALRIVGGPVLAVSPGPDGRLQILLGAAVSPGASGAPVLAGDGRVVGILNAGSAIGVYCGLMPCMAVAPSYAVPISALRPFVNLTSSR